MDIRILEQDKHRLKFELLGEEHTFCNALRKELWQGKPLDIAGYTIKHSLVSDPLFTVESEKEDPKKLLIEAVERLQKKK